MAIMLLAAPAITRAAEAAGSQSLHSRLQAYAALGLNLVYARQQVQDLQVIAGPVDPRRPLADQLDRDLQGTGLAFRRVTAETGYLVEATPRNRPETAAAVATPSPLEPAVSLMEEIVVTSPRQRLRRNDWGGTTVESGELEAYPVPARDVLRAVSNLPGQVPTGTGARHHMRGGGTDEVLYVLDGVRLIEPFHLRDFEALFSTFNPAIVGTVDVYSAGFPVSRGSRLAGVVDVSLLEPASVFEGEVDLNLLTAAVAAGGALGDQRWLASARRSVVDLLLDSAEHDYGRPAFNDGLLHVSADTGRYRWSAGVLSTNDELDLRDLQIGETAKADFHVRNLWMNAAWAVADRLALDASVLWTRVAHEREGRLDNPIDATGFLVEERRFDAWSARTVLTFDSGHQWVVRGGIDGGHQSGDFAIDLQARYGLLGVALQSQPERMRQASLRRAGDVFGLHVALSRVVPAGLDIEFGVRQDYQDVDPVHAHVTSPRLQLNWHADRWSVYAHAGRYAQLQELQEVDIDDGLFEPAAMQKLDHYSLGLAIDGKAGWSGGVDAWCRFSRSPAPRFENVYNRLVLLPELHADRIRFVPDRSRACGLDTHVRWSSDSGWTVRALYSHGRTEERIDGQWQSRPWEVKHLVRLFVQRETAGWNLLLGATWHSGWPRTGLQGAAAQPRFDDLRYRPYLAVDLHAGRVFTFGRTSLEFYLDAANALDRENPAGTVFQTSAGGIERRDRQLLPVIPNLGLRLVW